MYSIEDAVMKHVQRNTTEARLARLLAKKGMILVQARRYGLKIAPHPYAIVTPEGEVEGWFELEPLARKLGCLRPDEYILNYKDRLEAEIQSAIARRA